MSFIDTWNESYAHPLRWYYTREGLHQKAHRRFWRLLSIKTNPLDSKLLTSRLLLVRNIVELYLGLITSDDWLHFLTLANETSDCTSHIIQSDTRSRRRIEAPEAYSRFAGTIAPRTRPQALAA